MLVDKYSTGHNGEKMFNTVSLPLVLAEMMGYEVSETYRNQEREESRYIFSVNGNFYPIEMLE